MRRCGWLGLAALLACGDDGSGAAEGETGYIDEDIPAGNCGETDNEPCESSDDSGGSGVHCDETTDCFDGMICAAQFDGDIGAFECLYSCVDDRDESRWCIDDASCCNPDASCSERGYCIPPEAADTGTTGVDTGSETTGSDTSGDAGSTDESSSGGAAAPDERPNLR
jgi:hypothetical protein